MIFSSRCCLCDVTINIHKISSISCLSFFFLFFSSTCWKIISNFGWLNFNARLADGWQKNIYMYSPNHNKVDSIFVPSKCISSICTTMREENEAWRFKKSAAKWLQQLQRTREMNTENVLNTVSFFNLLHDMLARRTNNRKLKLFSAVCKKMLWLKG